jgi:hypothetical protein
LSARAKSRAAAAASCQGTVPQTHQVHGLRHGSRSTRVSGVSVAERCDALVSRRVTHGHITAHALLLSPPPPRHLGCCVQRLGAVGVCQRVL